MKVKAKNMYFSVNKKTQLSNIINKYNQIKLPFRTPCLGELLVDLWLSAMARTPKDLRKGEASMVLLTSWMLWKNHNNCTFNGAHARAATLLGLIKEETKLWARTGILWLECSPGERDAINP
jgi:hypothetical protein